MSILLNLSTNSILVEYKYYEPSSPDIISTNSAGFYLMNNSYTNQNYVMNVDGSENLTSNTRNRSATNIDNKNISYALLTTNKLGPAYNDYDTKLTSTNNLPLIWSNPEGIIYDTVRVHFIQGFSFNDIYNAISIRIAALNRNGKKINLLNGIYTYQDNWISLNGNPFLYGGRQYSTYIEFKVPALRYLKDSYKIEYQQNSNNDILAYKISDGIGFSDSSNIEIQAGLFSTITKKDNQYYTNANNIEVTSISSSDEFNEVGVHINDSANGDYIEFYGIYNGNIFGDYMNSLNTNGNMYIALHELVVSEQLPNTVDDYDLIGYYNSSTNSPDLSNNAFLSNFTDGSYWIASMTGYSVALNLNMNKGDILIYDTTLPSIIKIKVVPSDGAEFDDISLFVRTSEISYIQDSNFNEPNDFRPVLKYGGSALSFRINYNLKILNVNTNSTVQKSGSYLSFTPAKYGQELIKLNVLDNFKIFDVYNKKVVNVIGDNSNINSNEDLQISSSSLYSKNVTSFRETKNVNVSANTVIINEDNEIIDKSSSTSKLVYGQNLASIFISPFDNYVLFNLYDISNNVVVSYDLTKVGQLFLNFAPSKGEIIKITQEFNQSVKIENGQVLFRITKDTYQQIVGSENNNFFITTKSGNNTAETLLYSGRFLDSNKQTKDDIKVNVEKLNAQILDLKQLTSDQSLVIEQQATTIKTLNSDTVSYKEEIEREIAKRVSAGLSAARQTLGKTANDKEINRLSTNVKGSNFNTFGPNDRGEVK